MAAPKYKDLVPPGDKLRLLEAEREGVAGQLYALDARELAGGEPDADRKKELNVNFEVLNDEIAKVEKEVKDAG